MGPIVCATRGGEAGRRTQERAIALAEQRGSELIFMTVFDPSFAGDLNGALSAAVEKEQRWLGRALVSVAQARAKEQGVKASVVVLSGPMLESIEAFLYESEAQTLVIGEPKIDSPLSAFHRGAVQSSARRVEQKTHVEVVVVTPEA